MMLPNTLIGFVEDINAVKNFFLSRSSEDIRVFFGGKSNRAFEREANWAWGYSKMANVAKIVGIFALAIFLAGVVSSTVGIYMCATSSGAGMLTKQLVFCGPTALVTGASGKVGAWVLERIFYGLQQGCVERARSANFGRVPCVLHPYE